MRQRLGELWGFICFTGGGGHQDGPDTASQTELHREPYGCYSLLPLLSKTEYFTLGLQAWDTHTHSCFLLYGLTDVYFLAQILPQDI